jgi:UDP-N-acetylglucosamine 4-epimerase
MINKNILITGGAGFIGSHICEQLLKNGVKSIRIVDNLSTGNKHNIQYLLDTYDNIEFIWGDIGNLETCRNVCKDIDIICHQAALGSVPRSVNDPLSSHNSNINGTFNLLLAVKENGIKRFVYASSSSVYGDSKELPKVENRIGDVLSPYALNKKVCELYANIFTRCYDMECIGLRYFNVFGPRQNPNGAYAAVIPKFIELMKNGKSPTINGDGSFSRDFTYIDNVVQANILAMTTENKECFGQAFNIGAGGRVNLLELVNVINKGLKTDIKPTFIENRKGDISHSNADISKAMVLLEYNVNVCFKEGIINTIKSYYNYL